MCVLALRLAAHAAPRREVFAYDLPEGLEYLHELMPLRKPL